MRRLSLLVGAFVLMSSLASAQAPQIFAKLALQDMGLPDSTDILEADLDGNPATQELIFIVEFPESGRVASIAATVSPSGVICQEAAIDLLWHNPSDPTYRVKTIQLLGRCRLMVISEGTVLIVNPVLSRCA